MLSVAIVPSKVAEYERLILVRLWRLDRHSNYCKRSRPLDAFKDSLTWSRPLAACVVKVRIAQRLAGYNSRAYLADSRTTRDYARVFALLYCGTQSQGWGKLNPLRDPYKKHSKCDISHPSLANLCHGRTAMYLAQQVVLSLRPNFIL